MASGELSLAPDASTQLPEGRSHALDGLCSFNRQVLSHVESRESIGIDITVDQRCQSAQILFGHLVHPGRFRQDL